MSSPPRPPDRSRPSGHAPRRPRPHLDPLPATPRALRARGLGTPPGAGPPASRPVDRLLALPADDGARPGDEEVLRLLREADIVGVGRIPYSSNATFLLEMDVAEPGGGDRPLRAVYKPARGERPLWDFPHRTLHFREVGSYLVDAALGFGLVPPTVLRDGPLGPGSVQLFIHAVEAGRSRREALEAQLCAIAALDALVNNADRKSAHLLVERSGRLYGIDNGLTFLPYPRQRTVLLELGGSPLPDEVRAAVAALDRDEERRTALRERLERLLAPEEVDAFGGRLRELASDPVYPELDPWDGRPFEWW